MTYQPLIDNLKVLAIRQSELGNNGWASWASQAASAIADLSDFEQTMIARRGEIERTADDLERCRAALKLCVTELAYVHDCEVWINRGEERFAAIMAGREALS